MTILYGSTDGQKYEVGTPTLKARSFKKYFGQGKGVVAYTLLTNHILLQVEFIGAHEHESYFSFDSWYNNTTSIVTDAIMGNMHSINKEEWPNILAIIAALGSKEITQSTLIKKLYTYSVENCTRKAIFEYDKIIRRIYTLQYLRDRKLQRDVHRSQNRIGSYHQLRAAIVTAYEKKTIDR